MSMGFEQFLKRIFIRHKSATETHKHTEKAVSAPVPSLCASELKANA
jgi:hypothetical protein